MQSNMRFRLQVANPSGSLSEVVNSVTSPGVIVTNIKMRRIVAAPHVGGLPHRYRRAA